MLGTSMGEKSMRGGATGAGSVGVQSVGVEVEGMGLLGAQMGCEGIAGWKLPTLGMGPIDSSLLVTQSNHITSVTPIFKVTLNFILNGLAKYKVSRTFILELIL